MVEFFSSIHTYVQPRTIVSNFTLTNLYNLVTSGFEVKTMNNSFVLLGVLCLLFGFCQHNADLHTGLIIKKDTFINTSDSFAIPIGGERVTWGCLNG